MQTSLRRILNYDGYDAILETQEVDKLTVHGRMSADEISEILAGTVRERVAGHIEAGDESLIELSPESVKTAVDQWFAPSGARLADRVGPVYDAVATHQLLSIDRRQASDRRNRGTILALKTSDDHWVYPAFQFTGPTVNPQMKSMFSKFAQVSDTPWWTVAAWFRTTRTDLDGLTPADWVRNGRDLETVTTLVDELVRRWTR